MLKERRTKLPNEVDDGQDLFLFFDADDDHEANEMHPPPDNEEVTTTTTAATPSPGEKESINHDNELRHQMKNIVDNKNEDISTSSRTISTPGGQEAEQGVTLHHQHHQNTTIHYDNRFDEFNKYYEHKEGDLEMGKPRPCAYSKKTGYDNDGIAVVVFPIETVTIGEPIPRQKSPKGSVDITPMPVELRGITLRQLRAIIANMKRRCVKEKWTDWNGNLLTPDKVTLYDVNKYIIKPYTEKSEASFVETLPSTAGTQPPRFFVSHWWGETLYHTMDCLEQMIEDFEMNCNEDDDNKGGGMTEDTPIWICAFANNQHDLENAITPDPSKSGFAKAMEVANCRTVSILDKDGIVFTRIWCVFELYTTLMKKQWNKRRLNGMRFGHEHTYDADKSEWNALWAVYTAHEHTYHPHFPGPRGEIAKQTKGIPAVPKNLKKTANRKAVGIVQGGTTSEYCASDSALRQRHFPMGRIEKALTDIMVETAKASIKHDKRHILNYISGNTDNINVEPPTKHVRYDALNDALRGAFASFIPALQSACREGNEKWQAILTVMSKSITKEMAFDFKVGYDWDARGALDSWDGLSAQKAADMISHLPPSIEELLIDVAPYGSIFIDALIEWIKTIAKNLKYLGIRFTCVGGKDEGRDAGVRLAEALATNNTLHALWLRGTDLVGSRNVNEWAEALGQMTALESFRCEGMRQWYECGFNESTLDSNSTVELRQDKVHRGQRIYWKDGTFPDATMTQKDAKKLKKATHATDVEMDKMYREHNFKFPWQHF